jgi:CheY-like chemotaxis protein
MSGTIILLEDAATNRVIVAKMLENLGFKVLAGTNGEEGLKFCEQCEATGVPVVAVVSDMLMPVMDGPAFVRRLRENPDYETLPVIFMTAANDKSFLLQAKELKASYILKPVDMKQLAAKLESVSERQK